MTAHQYRDALGRLGLSQYGAAVLFGVSLRTSQGWALDEYPVPKPVADLLRLLAENKIKPEDLA